MGNVQVQLSKEGTRLELRKVYRASPEVLFRAWTDPALVSRWLAPSPRICEVAELDVREGGEYRIVMFNPENGNRVAVVGVYETVDPPKKLVFTWKWENNDAWHGDSLVSICFVPVEDGTELHLLHEQLPNAKDRDNHAKGWSACLNQLEEVL